MKNFYPRLREGIENMFSDPGNMKALRGYRTIHEPRIQFIITTDEPINISTDDDVEIAKLKMILNNHHIKYDVKEINKN
jgi:hypothetical protein